MGRGRFILAVVALATLLTTSVYASICMECHTDAERLKEIAKTIPKVTKSAETSGKG